MNLLNLISRATVHLIVFDNATKRPIQFGSGCIVSYRDKLIVLSVNHVTRIKGIETYTLIETCLPTKDGETPFYSTGGLVYFDAFEMHDIETGDLDRITVSEGAPLDVTFTAIKDDIVVVQKSFNYAGEEIEEGEKVFLVLNCATLPDAKDYFGFFGFIKHEIFDEQVIKSEVTFKLNLSYKGTHNRFHLFNTPDLITDEREFQGTSGAPILNSEGQLVGLVCSVLSGSKSVFAFPIDYCKQLIDIAIDNGIM